MSATWKHEAEGAPKDIAYAIDEPSNAEVNGGEEPMAAVVKQIDAAKQAALTLKGAIPGENFKVEMSGKSDGEPTDHYATGSITVTVSSGD